MVLERLLERLLLDFVAPYVDGVSKDKLRLGLLRGTVELDELAIKSDALQLLGMPGLRVQRGTIQLVRLSLRGLLSGKVGVLVKSLHIHVEQIGERARERTPALDMDLVREMRESKSKAIQLRVVQLSELVSQGQAGHGSPSSSSCGPAGFGARLARRIASNLNVDLQDATASYSVREPGFACGVELQELVVASTGEGFERADPLEELVMPDGSLYKLLTLRRFGFRMAEVGCSSLEHAAYALHPASGSVRLSHVPKRGVLRIRFEIAREEMLAMTLVRSQIKHLRRAQAAGWHESERLRRLMIHPKDEETLVRDVEETMAEYAGLYERQLLHSLKGRPSLSHGEGGRMRLLEDAISVRLLARRRLLVHEKVEARALRAERDRRTEEEMRQRGSSASSSSRFSCARRARDAWCRRRSAMADLRKVASGVRAGRLAYLAGTPAHPAAMAAHVGARSAYLASLARAQNSVADRDLDWLLSAAGDESKYQEIDVPQQLEFTFQLGRLSLDLIDDRWGQEPERQCFSLAAKQAHLAVSMNFGTDYHGRDSAEWRLEVKLGEFYANHSNCSVFEFSATGDADQQRAPSSEALRRRPTMHLGDDHAARLLVASELGRDGNVLSLLFDFAPAQIQMPQGLVEEVRDFWRAPGLLERRERHARGLGDVGEGSAAQASGEAAPHAVGGRPSTGGASLAGRSARARKLARVVTDLVLERADSSVLNGETDSLAVSSLTDMLCERLPGRFGSRGEATRLAEKVVQRIPDKIAIDVRIASPVFYVPVPGQGTTVMNLGFFHLRTPDSCDYAILDLKCGLSDMAFFATSRRGERFDMFKPVEIEVLVQYRCDDEGSKVTVEVEADHVSVFMAPQALQMFLATPFAAAGVMREKERIDAVPPEDKTKGTLGRSRMGSSEPSPHVEDFDQPPQELDHSSGGEDIQAEEEEGEEEDQRQFAVSVTLNWKALEVTLANSVVPVMVTRMQWPSPGLEVYRCSLPHSFLQVDMRFVLEVEILNPRNNAWEPLVENFHGALQMVREFTDHDSEKRIVLSGRDELLLNLKPSIMQRVAWFLPLFLKGFTFERDLVVTASDGDTSHVSKYRVVSLCSEELELEFKSHYHANLVTRVEPTGSGWRSLDEFIVSPYFATALVVRLPGGRSSEPLSLEHDGAVVVPDIGVVAELLTPSPLDMVQHRMLLLSGRLRIHNMTDLPLAVRFHSGDLASPELLAVPSTLPCDAALLGHLPPEHLDQTTSIGGKELFTHVSHEMVCEEEEEEAILQLPPNAIGAAPLPALAREASEDCMVPLVWLSARTAGSDFAWSDVAQAGAFLDAAVLSCRGMEGNPENIYLVCESTRRSVLLPSPLTLTTVTIRPPLRLLNALPIGDLHVGYGPKTAERMAGSCRQEDVVPRLRRRNLYSFPGNPLEDGLTFRARLDPGRGGEPGPWTPPLHFDAGSLEERGGASRPLQLKLKQTEGGAAAGVVVEHLAGFELRFSSPFWFVDRSGPRAPLELALRAGGRPLPHGSDVTLLPAECLEDCCDLSLRGCGANDDPATAVATHGIRIPVSWSTLTMATSYGPFVFCMQVDDVAASDVLGASCQLVTLRPRLMLHNASCFGLEIMPKGSRERPLSLAAGQSMALHWRVGTGEEERPSTSLTFRPKHQSAGWSGDVLCSDEAAGSTPFLLAPARSRAGAARARSRRSSHQVWSVEVAPSRGSLAVSFRQGSEFVAQNRVSRVKADMIVQPTCEDGQVVNIRVPAGGDVPYGWSTPFDASRKRSVYVIINGIKKYVSDVQRTQRRKILQLRCVLTVSRMGSQTLLTLEDHESTAVGMPKKGKEGKQAFAVEIKLARLGISLIEEAPQPRELFFLHLDLIRLRWENRYDKDLQQLSLTISDVQADCQLTGRADADAADPAGALAVVLANRGAGEGVFLRLLVERHATSGRDLCLPRAQIALDFLDVTVDDAWLEPLVRWVTQCRSGGMGPGVPLREVEETAGVPMAVRFKPPELPSVVHVEALRVSRIDLTLWAGVKPKTWSFLPAYLHTALKVLSFSDKLTLDGAMVSLPERSVQPHRGSLNDFLRGLASEYAVNLVQNTGRVLGNSSLLHLPRVPLNLGGSAVSYLTDSVGRVAGEAASLLNQLTFDDEYIARQRAIRSEKQIHGFHEGMAEAGKSLGQGIEGIFDVVKKPAEGWRSAGLVGAVVGCGRGVAGGFVKPVSNIGQAISDVGSGISAEVDPESVKRRKRAEHRRLRQPRLLFTEGAAARPWCELDAQLLRQLGDRVTWGIQEVVPLQREGQCQTVLLLYTYRLVLAQIEVDMPTEGSGNDSPGSTPTRSTSLLGQVGESSTKLLMEAMKPIHQLERNVQNLDDGPVETLGGARGLEFSDLRSVRSISEPNGQLVELRFSKGVYQLSLHRAPEVTPVVERALVSGLASAVSHPDGAADWAELRSALRKEHRSRQQLEERDGRPAVLEMEAGEKALEVFEVERWRFTHKAWETPFMPTDCDLTWRWVDASGWKHPLCQKLSKVKISASVEPPCEMDGTFRAKAGWRRDIHAGTDREGWRYGLVWKASTWDPQPGIFDVLRRRKWIKVYT